MSDSKKGFSKYQDYINESKEEIIRHLNMRAYIKNFLEKHIWLEHQTAFPSYVGTAFSELTKEKELIHKKEEKKLAYVCKHESQANNDFLERLTRISNHIMQNPRHSKALELLFGAALIIIREELKKFEEFNIYIQHQTPGGKPDFTIEIPGKINNTHRS